MKTLVAVGVVAMLATTTMAANLVTNGTFTSNITGWTFNDNGSSGFPMSSISSAPDLPAPPNGNCLGMGVNKNIANSVWYTQTVSGLTVGQTYQFDGDYAGGFGISGNSNSTLRWGMLLEAGSSNNWGMTGYPGVGGTSPGYGAFNPVTNTGFAGEVVNNYNTVPLGQWGWTHVTQTFTAAQTSITISLLAGSGTAANSQGNFFAAGFDNISLQAVPEPASVLLLACGGLAVLRRRRLA